MFLVTDNYFEKAWPDRYTTCALCPTRIGSGSNVIVAVIGLVCMTEKKKLSILYNFLKFTLSGTNEKCFIQNNI